MPFPPSITANVPIELLTEAGGLATERGLSFSTFARESMRVLAAFSDLGVDKTTSLVHNSALLDLPRIRSAGREKSTSVTIIVPEAEKDVWQLASQKAKTSLSERVRRSLRLSTFILQNDVIPITVLHQGIVHELPYFL